MKIAGIIAEYNPFHNGHAYQLAEARRRTGADYVVAAMSGDFVQRGAPALMDKYARARMALSCGVDLVIELPALWACASAEHFAAAGVALFDKMGCVNALCFGAETDSLPLLSLAAEILADEPKGYRAALAAHLKEGLPFPAARERALSDFCGMPQLHEILSSPNNILAIEYLKALRRRKSPITPVLIRRVGAGYHEEALGGPSRGQAEACPSASAIRRLLLAPEADSKRTGGEYGTGHGGFSPNASQADAPSLGGASATGPGGFSTHASQADAPSLEMADNIENSRKRPSATEFLAQGMPQATYDMLLSYQREAPFLAEDDFSAILGYQLLSKDAGQLALLADCSRDIANRLHANRLRFRSFSSFCNLMKSRDITYSRMSRILLHLILRHTKEDYALGLSLDYVPYLRILGFRREILSSPGGSPQDSFPCPAPCLSTPGREDSANGSMQCPAPTATHGHGREDNPTSCSHRPAPTVTCAHGWEDGVIGGTHCPTPTAICGHGREDNPNGNFRSPHEGLHPCGDGSGPECMTLLGQIKKSAEIPLISKPANARKLLPEAAFPLWEKDIFAANLYEQVKFQKYAADARPAGELRDDCSQRLAITEGNIYTAH